MLTTSTSQEKNTASIPHFDWKSPDYGPIFQARINTLANLRANPGILAGVKEFYKDNPVQFISDQLLTFDPRAVERGLPATMPFLLFPKQEEFIRWLLQRWKSREDGLTEKSRDMGISWCACAFAVWMWTFHPGVVVGFGSRRESYVDEIGNPASLFWKLRQLIETMPREFRPSNYNAQKDAPYMRIINPENGSVIVGESGSSIGRGNRTSLYILDEAAFLEHPEQIEASLSQTSNCKISVSTPNGNGNVFYRKRHSGKVSVFSFHWRDDPRKGVDWYQKQADTLDPVILASECDLDYNASVADSWISGEQIATAQRLGPADVKAVGQWIIGVDAAHFGDDESVIHKRKGRLNLPQVVRKSLDGPSLARLVEEECATLERSGGEIHAIAIELDGPGVSAFDQLRRGQFKDKVRGVHTGTRLSDNKNYNLKAKMWREMQEYFTAGQVSLPTDQELKAQLASVRYGYKDGMLLMQSKKDYKGRFSKSPDRADAMALTFAVSEPPKPKVKQVQNRPAFVGSWM